MNIQLDTVVKIAFSLWVSCLMSSAWSSSEKTMALDQVLEMTAHNHPSVKAALARVEGAKAAQSAAEWQRYPAVTIQSENGTDQNGVNQLVSQLRVQQSIWTAGRTTAAINAAQARQQAAYWAVYATQGEVVSKAMEIWRALIFAYESNKINLKTVERLEKYVRMMQRRVAAQISPQIESELIGARLAQARVEQIASAAAIRTGLERLSQITGNQFTADDLAQVTLPKPDPFFAGMTEQEMNDLFLGAAKEHPSVQRAKAEADAARYDVEVKNKEQFPAVYLRYQHQVGGISSVGTKPFALQLQYAPGAGLSSIEQTRVAAAQLVALTEAENAAYSDIKEGMVTDWLALREAQDREVTLGTMVEKSNLVLDSYERLFIAGKKSWQDVLNTVREVSQNELAQLNTNMQALVLPYRLRLQMQILPWQQGTNK